jgi:peptide/nickel transport system permease protein
MSTRYVLTRLLFAAVVLWTAATLNFVLPRLSGKDPIRERLAQQAEFGSVQAGGEEMVRAYDAKFGLDRPLWAQYLTFLGDLARFDLGYSMAYYPKPVGRIIAEALPWSIGLLAMTTLVSFTLGTFVGALLAWPPAPRWIGYLAPPLITLSAIPYYLLGLLVAFVFAYALRWFPGSGGSSIGGTGGWSWASAADVARHAVLPAMSIVLASVGAWALSMRATMVTTHGEDYLIFGEAKGLTGRTLFLNYAVRNSLLPQTTSLALAMAYVVSGAVLVEVAFAYPGIGLVLVDSIRHFDYTTIQGIVLTIITALSLLTLLLDLALPLLDPRVSYRHS